MQRAPTSNIANEPADATAASVVNEYLRLLMIPDPDSARRFISPELEIRFTGNRLMRDPAECASFNAARYGWVKKRIEATEVVAGGAQEHAVVYSRGSLYGVWPDGTPFEGNRYVDRYVVSHGRITKMDVWNDSAEWLLMRAASGDPGVSGNGETSPDL